MAGLPQDYLSKGTVDRIFREIYCDYDFCGGKCLNCKTAEFRNKINKEPAADVQPVKRGHWYIDNEGYERCSVCNMHETGMRYFSFCPSCGVQFKR